MFTLLTFVDKYYEYDGDKDPENKALTIGGFESAWLADLVGAYLLANTKEHFKETRFDGIYRDDGFAAFIGKWSYDQIATWRDNFQAAVNILTEGDYLQFTCSIWIDETVNQPGPKEPHNKMVSIERGTAFPYLDMELYWSEKEELQFRVHLKPNQELKYLNRGSTHTEPCFKAISSGVFQRLVKLTTVTPKNENKTIDEMYPKHTEALRRAELIEDKTPTMREILDKEEERKKPQSAKKAHQKKRDRKRAIHFCIGHSKAWIKPIHKIIKAY